MNARLQPQQLYRAFDASSNYTFPMARFAPEIGKVACINFPLQEIAADIGIRDAQAVSLDDITSNKIQSLDSIYFNLAMQTFSMLQECDLRRSPLWLDVQSERDAIQIDGLRARAPDGVEYFCANLSVIRDVVEHYSGVVYGDLDDMAKALQKALVAKALQSNKPVVIFECLIGNADKEILCKADSFLRDQAANDNDAASLKMDLERK